MNFSKKFLTIVAVLMLAATGTSGVHAAPNQENTTQDALQAASFIEKLTTPELTPAVTAPPKTVKVQKKAETPETTPEAPVETPVEPLPQAAPEPAIEPVPVIEVQSLPPAPAPAPEPVPAPVPAPIVGHGDLASAALAQLGIQQDCTRMVENALASIGRPVGDLAPSGFLGVGTIVGGPPQSGDILVYGGHVAIALGPDSAVHGGFNGGTTAIGPVDVGQGAPIVVRV